MFQGLHGREAFADAGNGPAIRKTIVERHAGDISVEPASRQGSVFRFATQRDHVERVVRRISDFPPATAAFPAQMQSA